MEPAIRARGLTKSYGALCAVSGLDLDIGQGEAFGLLGPNGAGKSTTINLMLGLIRPSAGSVDILGYPAGANAARQAVGYVAQDSDFPLNLTAREILNLVTSHYRDPVPGAELVDDFELQALVDRQAGGFSGGERRRLALALAFAGRGRIVFLDEPTTGLDGAARRRFWNRAKAHVQDGGTLVITTHQLNEIEDVAKRICVIDHGEIRLEGTVEYIRRQLGRKTIRFACDGLPDLSPVSAVHESDGIYQIVSADADEVVRQLVASGAAFRDLEIVGASLEEAIESLMPEAGEIR